MEQRLPAPYEFITRIDNNNYYLLEIGDTLYLAIETILNVTNVDKDENNEIIETEREVQQGLKIMPIYFCLEALLRNAACAVKIDERRLSDDDDDEDGVLNIYAYPEYDTLEKYNNVLNIDAIRTAFATKVKELKKEQPNYHSRFDYEYKPKSQLMKAFIKRGGYQVLMAQKMDSRLREVWLAKANKYGDITVQAILLGGTIETAEQIMLVSTFVFNVDLARTILDYLMQRFALDNINEDAITQKEEE